MLNITQSYNKKGPLSLNIWCIMFLIVLIKQLLFIDFQSPYFSRAFVPNLNGSQLAKMKKSIPHMSLLWNL